MKNVTVSLDEESYRRGRIRAAEEGTTLSAMVREYLNEFGHAETEEERTRRELQAMFDEIDRKGLGVNAGERLTRDELYDQARGRRDDAEAARD